MLDASLLAVESFFRKSPASVAKTDTRSSLVHKLPKNSNNDNSVRSKTVRLLKVPKRDAHLAADSEIEQLGAAIDSLSTKTSKFLSTIFWNGTKLCELYLL